jgi:hypothetical protein
LVGEFEKILLSSFEEDKTTTYSLINEEEIKKPRFYRGFFTQKNGSPA